MLPTMTEPRMTLGKDSGLPANDQLRINVRELMDLRNWSQADLAERLKRSQPWLSKRLTGTTPFHMKDVDEIAHVFGLAPAELLCVGFGKWDRRHQPERRSGVDRRQRAFSVGRRMDDPVSVAWAAREDDEPVGV